MNQIIDRMEDLECIEDPQAYQKELDEIERIELELQEERAQEGLI